MRRHNRPLILIADDMRTNRLIIQKTLADEGYDFIEASNGEEALQQAKKHHPTMILIDGLMPVMDGFEAVRQMREIEEIQRTPILMLSSLSEKEARIQAIECGVNDFVTKPFDEMELIARCKSYIKMDAINRAYILSTINPISGLPNRTALLKEIEGKRVRMIMLQLEKFYAIEGFYGKKSVNRIEKEVSLYFQELFLSFFGTPQQIFHTSEGEFTILIDSDVPDIESAHLDTLCKEIYSQIKKHELRFDNFEYDVRATLAYIEGTEHLYEDLKFALEYAIEHRKEYVIAHKVAQSLKKETEANMETIRMLKKAIKEDRIVAFFQPLYDIERQEITKYEALVRLIDEEGKIISPFHFLEAAKIANYYWQITQIMLKKVFGIFCYIDKEVTFNLSYADISHEQTVNMIFDMLKKDPDTASRLTFELLEDETIESDEVMNRFIKEVREYGVKIAIDDFGSGYSNFQRIIDIRPDILKVDGSIIKHITTSEENRTLAQTIQNFAENLGIRTVAEFVSDESIFMEIGKIGFNYAQGYYISEPREKLVTITSHMHSLPKKEKRADEIHI